MKERVQLFTQRLGESDQEFGAGINEWLAAQEGEFIDAKLVVQTAMQPPSAGGVTRMAKVHKIVLVTWRAPDEGDQQ
jgi:hypothetical protein